MSPTLLEAVVILIILVVAWQLGIRLAPIILGALYRAVEQVKGSRPQADVAQDPPQKLLTDKENSHDQP